MQHRIFPVILVLALGVPAFSHAQDNKIRVVQPDGTVQEVEIPGWGAPEPKGPEASAPQDTATLPPAAKREAQEQKSAPEKSAAGSAKGEKKKKKKKAEKPQEKPEQKLPADPENIGRPVVEPQDPVFPPGTEITKEMALSVALGYAPPARSVEVLPRTYEGKAVFVVRFRTDEGLKDILIDRTTGQPIWKD